MPNRKKEPEQVRQYMDVEGEIVETTAAIRGIKGGEKPDGSIRFKLIGGPLHDMVMRVYPPFDTIRFPRNSGGYVWYDLNPPLKSGGSWTYVYDAIRSEGETRNDS